jgi:hypothetical protein
MQNPILFINDHTRSTSLSLTMATAPSQKWVMT